jgi:uncharacterized protein (DUF1810 family)
MRPIDTQPANADPLELNRFIEAQAEVYERALAELKQGEKTSHWMWFMFPRSSSDSILKGSQIGERLS